jgi:prophage regulatory protein
MNQQTAKNSAATDAAASTRLLRLPEVLSLVGVSWRTLLRWEREGRFPKRYKIGPRVVAWKECEIDQWVAERDVAATSTRPSI